MGNTPMNAMRPNEMAEGVVGQEAPDRTLVRMVATVQQMEDNYRKFRAGEDARNLAYWRGQFWAGDGIRVMEQEIKSYRAQLNETFPILDTIASALAMDLPQVEALDHRSHEFGMVPRSQDPFFVGKRIAAVLNLYAMEDDLDDTLHQMVLHSLIFAKGGIVKAAWSAQQQRVIWRLKMPWEVFFDPQARRMSDVNWAFERFPIHYETYKQRIEDGVYRRPTKEIKPDTYPRSLVEDEINDEQEKDLRSKGLREYITIYEYWDFRKGVLYHFTAEPMELLMVAPLPYGNPYTALVYNNGIGRLDGVPDATLIAPVQRDINELVSARREMVARLPRRMMLDRRLFRSEEEWERFKNSRAWEPTLLDAPPDGNIQSSIFVSPEMPTTFDFNKHLDSARENVRYIPGTGDFQRGQVANIRTAAEANMIRASVEGRMNVRVRRTVKAAKQMFDRALECVRWAVSNPEASGIDIARLWLETQSDVDVFTFRMDLLNENFKFRLLPFSPLMEDKVARRSALERLLAVMANTPMAPNFDWRELAREVQDAYNMRPSVVTETPPPPPAPLEAAMPGAPAGLPPGLAAGPIGGAPAAMGPAPMMPMAMAPGMEGGQPLSPQEQAALAAIMGGQPPIMG